MRVRDDKAGGMVKERRPGVLIFGSGVDGAVEDEVLLLAAMVLEAGYRKETLSCKRDL